MEKENLMAPLLTEIKTNREEMLAKMETSQERMEAKIKANSEKSEILGEIMWTLQKR
jgi:hypothetical protein